MKTGVTHSPCTNWNGISFPAAIGAITLLGGLIALLACYILNNRAQAVSLAERLQFERAMISTIYGERYRTLPATPNRPPLYTLHNRYPELATPEIVQDAFTNAENGYVLLMWIGELPAQRREDFLFGLELVIGDVRRRGGDLAQATNRFHDNFQSAILSNGGVP